MEREEEICPLGSTFRLDVDSVGSVVSRTRAQGLLRVPASVYGQSCRSPLVR